MCDLKHMNLSLKNYFFYIISFESFEDYISLDYFKLLNKLCIILSL